MKKIGLVVAIERELVALLESGKIDYTVLEEQPFSIFRFIYDDNEVFVAHSSAGQIDAALATQLLIIKYGAELILNYGVVGALSPKLKVGDLLAVTKTVKHDLDFSFEGVPLGQYDDMQDRFFYPSEGIIGLCEKDNITPAVLASGDQFIDGYNAKKRLADMFGADICDMEGAAIARTCYRYNIPWFSVKCISDSLDGGAVLEFGKYVTECGNRAFKYLLDLIGKL